MIYSQKALDGARDGHDSDGDMSSDVFIPIGIDDELSDAQKAKDVARKKRLHSIEAVEADAKKRVKGAEINKKFKAKRAKQILDGDAVVLAKVQGQKDRANERKRLARIESKRQVDAGNINALYKKTEQKAKKADSG